MTHWINEMYLRLWHIVQTSHRVLGFVQIKIAFFIVCQLTLQLWIPSFKSCKMRGRSIYNLQYINSYMIHSKPVNLFLKKKEKPCAAFCFGKRRAVNSSYLVETNSYILHVESFGKQTRVTANFLGNLKNTFLIHTCEVSAWSEKKKNKITQRDPLVSPCRQFLPSFELWRQQIILMIDPKIDGWTC